MLCSLVHEDILSLSLSIGFAAGINGIWFQHRRQPTLTFEIIERVSQLMEDCYVFKYLYTLVRTTISYERICFLRSPHYCERALSRLLGELATHSFIPPFLDFKRELGKSDLGVSRTSLQRVSLAVSALSGQPEHAPRPRISSGFDMLSVPSANHALTLISIDH